MAAMIASPLGNEGRVVEVTCAGCGGGVVVTARLAPLIAVGLAGRHVCPDLEQVRGAA